MYMEMYIHTYIHICTPSLSRSLSLALTLLSLRIQYISLVRLSCYTHNPAHMSVLLFYLHVYYSNSCVCGSKCAYAFPSSSIFVHIYRHFRMYCLCYVLY